MSIDKIKMPEKILNFQKKQNKFPILKNPYILSNNEIVEDFDLEIENDNELVVSNEYINENTDLSLYQEQLNNILETTTGSRNKAVAAATFLATSFPKLPYFWGGGHECSIDNLVGINPDWGILDTIIYGGSNYYKVGEQFPYSLDCSGFVTWCLKNANYDINSCLGSDDCLSLGDSVSITDTEVLDFTKAGDVGWMDGHVGVVIDVNKVTKEITFAHLSGSGYGMNITTISTETGLVTKDDQGVLPEIDKNGNTVNAANRVGKEYFTNVVSVPYED